MRFVVSFVVLFIFWIVLSGNFDAFHLSLGFISTLIVTLWSGDFLIQDTGDGLGKRIGIFLRFIPYAVWLIYQIVLANIYVIKVAFSARLEDVLEPQMVKFTTSLKSSLARLLLAHSITLTPGTVTVEIEGNTFMVHALTRETAEGVPGEMEERIRRVFGEESHV